MRRARTPAPAATPSKRERVGGRYWLELGCSCPPAQSSLTLPEQAPSPLPPLCHSYGALSNGIRTVITAHTQQNPGTTISYRCALGRVLFAGVLQAVSAAADPGGCLQGEVINGLSGGTPQTQWHQSRPALPRRTLAVALFACSGPLLVRRLLNYVLASTTCPAGRW